MSTKQLQPSLNGRRHTSGKEAHHSRGWGGFCIASVTLFLLLAQSGAPSPLYPVYQHNFRLAPAATTAIFSIYICGLLLALLTVGTLSDHVGRRPVIIAAALLSIASLAIFADADSLLALLSARALQGVGVGTGTGAVGAAIIDLVPPERARLGAVLNGVMTPAGLAAGALGSGFLVQYGPAPTVTVYVVFGALIATAAVMIAFIAERHPRTPVTLSIFRPRIAVPGEVRRVFGAVVGCMISSMALAGLYLGMGPTIIARILGNSSHIAAGVGVALVTGTGAVTGIVSRSRNARTTMLVGAVSLIIGPVLTTIALTQHSTWGFYASAPIAGIGFGAAFQGGLRMLLAAAPEEGRSGLLSAVWVVSYIALGVPAMIAGWLVPTLGFHTVVNGYAAFIVLVAGVALVLQLLLTRIRGVEGIADATDAAEGI
ncbi:MFS transporter [Streptomyces sp. NPDC086082]|uniref:MFS transporter n=1 Tax=Streptomyces sp. NPDC086082 TaxID=3365750 RepID=UPI0037FA2EC6